MFDTSKASKVPYTSIDPSVKPESKRVPPVITMDTYVESTYATVNFVTQEGNLVKYDTSLS